MKKAFVFAGQGAQDTGMGVSLCESSKAARQIFGEASEVMGEDLLKLCAESPKELLSKTKYAQPVTFTMDVAAMSALVEKGIEADFAAGFSLGEYAALVCAGVLSFSVAMPLVRKRGEFMAECDGGAMLAVLGMEAAALEALCRETGDMLWPVNYNSPGQIVVAGEPEAITALEAALKAQRVRRVRLPVSGAFHSPLMKPAAQKLSAELKKVQFYEPKLPLVLNLTGDAAPKDADFADLLTKQCQSPVLWEASVRKLSELGAGAFVECGHGGVLTGLVNRTLAGVPAMCVHDALSLFEAVESL